MGERRIITARAGIGLLATVAAMCLGPGFGPDYELPRFRPSPQPKPRVSYAETKRRLRAAEMLMLAAKPQPLKHMHSAARRALLASAPQQPAHAETLREEG